MVAFKVLVGAALVLLIHFVSLSKNYLLASLIPLFPTFTFIGAPDEFFSNEIQASASKDRKELRIMHAASGADN